MPFSFLRASRKLNGSALLRLFQSRVLPTIMSLPFLILTARAQSGGQWTWQKPLGHNRTTEELTDILQKHEEWVNDYDNKPGARADLSGAFLVKADLHDRLLIRANFSGSFLDGANLSGALLHDSDLSKASLGGADLTKAQLILANLDSVNLQEANLKGSRWDQANMRSVNYEPRLNPEISDIAGANNLEFMTYTSNSVPLALLCDGFRNGGYRPQERKITFALKRRDAELLLSPLPLRLSSTLGWERVRGEIGLLWNKCRKTSMLENCGAYTFNLVFFELTCQYGMHSDRALSIVVILWFFSAVAYSYFIHRRGRSGLSIVARRIRSGKEITKESQIRPRAVRQSNPWKIPFYVIAREWRVFRVAMFFSLMSAFNIGFRDINFGRWLRLLTKREYDIKAGGWARTVAGFQSLISVYLIALWVLTFFGRPFD